MRKGLFAIVLLAVAPLLGEIPEDVLATAETFAGAVPAEQREAWETDAARLQEAYARCFARIENPSLDIIVPFERHPNGRVKLEAKAGKAMFFEDEELVWCGDVLVREFTEAGEVSMALAATGLLLDRRSRSVWMEGLSSGYLRDRFGSVKIHGEGIYFSSEDEFVKISSKVTVDSPDIKFEGVKL